MSWFTDKKKYSLINDSEPKRHSLEAKESLEKTFNIIDAINKLRRSNTKELHLSSEGYKWILRGRSLCFVGDNDCNIASAFTMFIGDSMRYYMNNGLIFTFINSNGECMVYINNDGPIPCKHEWKKVND